MELISRNDAIKCLDGNVFITEQKEAEAVKEYFETVIARLKALPAIEERKEGHWIRDGHHIRCSECFEYICDKDREGDTIPQNFCPNCGAKMKGE